MTLFLIINIILFSVNIILGCIFKNVPAILGWALALMYLIAYTLK